MTEAPTAKTYMNAMLGIGFMVVTMCALGAVLDIADRKAKGVNNGKGR